MSTPTNEMPTAAPRERKRKEQAVATAWSAAETFETWCGEALLAELGGYVYICMV